MRNYPDHPTAYSSLEDLQRGLVQHLRRFRRACTETAAASGPITLNPVNKQTRVGKTKVDPLGQLEVLRDQVVLLKNMSAQILVNFAGSQRANTVRKTVDALTADIEAKADQLRKDMSTSARKQVDRTVVSRNHLLIEELGRDLRNFTKGIKESYLVGDITPPGFGSDTVQADVAYAVIEDLRGPDGYVHPMYFVLTAHPRAPALIGKKLANMYVAVSPEFKTPGRVRWEATANNPKELVKIASDLLTRDGVIGKAFTRNIPVPTSRIKFVHDNVKSTSVKGDQITVRVKDPKKIDETCSALRSQLASIVKQVDPKNRDLIRYKLDRPNGIIRFIFSLPAKLRGRLVDNDVLMKIRKLLSLSEEQTQRVRTALEQPE